MTVKELREFLSAAPENAIVEYAPNLSYWQELFTGHLRVIRYEPVGKVLGTK